MKSKGFTLIELLAVIVILAIIALIAVPIILNIIDSSKNSANERSKELYLDAVEQAIARKNLTGEYNPTKCDVIKNSEDLSCEKDGAPLAPLTVEVNGEKPSSGTIKFENGKITEETLVFGDSENKEEATKTVYRWSTDRISIGDTINPSDTTKFTTDPTTLEYSYYLKHVVDKDNKVTESYSCAVYNNREFCVRGGSSDYYGYSANESEYTGNLLILKGLQDEEFNCTFYDDNAYCSVGIVDLTAVSNGSVEANGGGDRCNVYGDGSSDCQY